MARGLRMNRMRVISLVMRPLDWLGEYQPTGVDYFMRLVGAAAVKALDEGYTLLLVRDPTVEGTPDIAYSVDGCIIADPEAGDPVIRAMEMQGVPVVSIGRDVSRTDFVDWVGDQGREQANTMLDHLYRTGARSICVLMGTQTNAWNSDSHDAALEWAGHHPHVEVTIEARSEAEGVAGGRTFAEELMASGAPLPDAMYVLTGRHAAGVTAAFIDAGLSVPGDIQVASGNDSEQCRTSIPAITAVNLNPEGLGQEAVRLLLDRIEGGTEVPRAVESIYLFRDSTRVSP